MLEGLDAPMTDRPINANLARILDEHDMRIVTLVERVGSLDHKVDAVISAVSDLKTIVAASQAKSSVTFGGILSYTRDLAVLVGLAVSAIVYITMASTSGRTALVEYRMEQMELAHGRLFPSARSMELAKGAPPPPASP